LRRWQMVRQLAAMRLVENTVAVLYDLLLTRCELPVQRLKEFEEPRRKIALRVKPCGCCVDLKAAHIQVPYENGLAYSNRNAAVSEQV
jgi:hypothetical protein